MEKMSCHIPEPLMHKFCTIVVDAMGLYFPVESWAELERKLRGIDKAFGFPNLISCLEWLTKSNLTKDQIAILAHHLTIGETYFFREKACLEELEKKIFPKLISERQGNSKTLRIWSAACCTGEEPYSIAILLHSQLLDLPNWNILILGTDINYNFLKKAEKAIYNDWSLRATPSVIKDRYFVKKKEGSYALIPEIKKMVKFEYLNLAEDTYPSQSSGIRGMDIILCNNLLIYFSPKQIKQAVQKMTATLNDEGILCVSPIEVPYIHESKLFPFKFGDVTLFKKVNDPLLKNCLKSFDNQPGINNAVINKSSSYFHDVSDEDDDIVLSRVFQTVGPSKSFLKQPSETLKPKSLSKDKIPVDDLTKHYNEGDYEKIIQKLESHLNSFKNNPDRLKNHIKDLTLLIQSYANQGQLSLALEWCEHGLKADTLNPMLYFLHASIMQEMGQPNVAIQSLKSAIFIDHQFVMAHFSLGNLLLKQGLNAASQKHFRNAIELIKSYQPEDIIEGSEGLTAGNLLEIFGKLYTNKQKQPS